MIVLKSSCLEAHILAYGATLAGLWYDSHPQSLVLGSPDAAAYQGPLTYSGAVVGPVANRVGGGVVTLEGARWQMDANEGQTSLHSGAHGLHARVWQVTDHSDSHVVLQCNLPEGDCGLPGQRCFQARYGVTNDGTLQLDLSATSDRDTLVNLAHHPYWRLGVGPTVADHRLQVMADHYLPVDANTLPTGDITPVYGTVYDFRTAQSVPVDQTLDANLCLSRTRRAIPQPTAVLTAPDGITLTIETTEAGLQIYNATGFSPAPVRLHAGQALTPGAGVALEPQGWPDAPNNSVFPSILLRAGETYRQETLYHISK